MFITTVRTQDSTLRQKVKEAQQKNKAEMELRYDTKGVRKLPEGYMTWWTIGTLLLTNLIIIYIHFSHTPAGVVTTSLTILYLPSNPLQPCSVACTSFWITTRLLTLICQWFLWPYSCWNALPLLKHSLISSTCINRLLECNQSLKLGLLWILDLQSLTMSDLLSFIEPQKPPTCALECTLRSAKRLSDVFHLTCLI